jgi:hypothetical protein
VGKFVEVVSGGSIIVPGAATMAAGDIVTVINNHTAGITITCSALTAYVAGVNTARSSVTLYTRGMLSVFFLTPSVCILTGNIT